VAISPIEKRYARRMVEKLGLEFPLLGDPGNKVASAYRLTVSVPEPLREVYRSWGIDLERVNGEAGWTLPLASRYVIGRDGVIADAQTDIDHTRRTEPEETLAVLRLLREG
jgi:peroxiredoxin